MWRVVTKYKLKYIKRKRKDPNSQLTGLAVRAVTLAFIQEYSSNAVIRVVRKNNVPLPYWRGHVVAQC
jgi:hypothetical protein